VFEVDALKAGEGSEGLEALETVDLERGREGGREGEREGGREGGFNSVSDVDMIGGKGRKGKSKEGRREGGREGGRVPGCKTSRALQER
jgi:hypothetical protein